jgi:uncharacterized repeat protein (TIGR03803 family)
MVFGVQAAALAAPATTAPRTFGSSSDAHLTPRSATVLRSFSGTDGSAPEGNLDLGLTPSAQGPARTLYGTTEGGGAGLSGTICSYVLGSNVLASLYSFTGANDGGIPLEGLANNESNYFLNGSPQLGVTLSGGADGQGTVYAVGANGQPVVIHAFTGGTDGGSPAGRLTRFVDGNYYGTTSSRGGPGGFGTIYRVTPTGGCATIYTFNGLTDGGSPQAGLALNLKLGDDAGTLAAPINAAASPQYVAPFLYGTTSTAGANGVGTIFRITPAGTLHTLYSFTGGLDGGIPAARLTSDLLGNLYGSATVGGSGGNGVIFKLAFGTSAPHVIHDFGDGSTGATPLAQLTL